MNSSTQYEDGRLPVRNHETCFPNYSHYLAVSHHWPAYYPNSYPQEKFVVNDHLNSSIYHSESSTTTHSRSTNWPHNNEFPSLPSHQIPLHQLCVFRHSNNQDICARSGPSNEAHWYYDGFQQPNTSISANTPGCLEHIPSPSPSQGLSSYSNNNASRNSSQAVDSNISDEHIDSTTTEKSNLCNPIISEPTKNFREKPIRKLKLHKEMSRTCTNCKTTLTPLWRRKKNNQQEIVCNACGLYFNLHLKDRPLTLKKDIIQTRKKKFSEGDKYVSNDAAMK